VYYGSNADGYGICRYEKKEDNTGRKLRKEAGATRGVIPVGRYYADREMSTLGDTKQWENNVSLG
jgi:hypothetical protein